MTDKPDLRMVLQFYGVDLNGSRREASVLCPIHEETRPSCSVNEEKSLIHCQSCGFGGDAYAIIMSKENCDFREALEFAKRVFNHSAPDAPARAGRSAGRQRGSGFRPNFRTRPLSH